MAKKKKLTEGFNLELLQSAYFVNVIKVITTIFDEMIVKPNPEALVIEGTVEGSVSLVKIVVPKDKFKIYEIGIKNTELVMSLEDFKKIIIRCTKEDTIQLRYNPADAKLVTTFKRDSGRNRTFRLSMLGSDAPNLGFEKIIGFEFPIHFNTEPEMMEEILKDAEIYSGVFTLSTSKNEEDIIFRNTSVIGDFEGVLGSEELTNLVITKPGSTMLAIENVKKMLALKMLTEELSIETGDGYPLFLKFNLKNGMNVLFAQAPRIDQEDVFDEDEDMAEAVAQNNESEEWDDVEVEE